MGGRGRSRTQRKHFRQSRENVWKRSKSDDSANAPPDGGATIDRKPSWEPFATQNPCFDEYYKEQEIVPTDEWDAFVGYLRKPLPAAFRINSSSQFYEDIRLQLENDFVNSLQSEDIDGNEVEAIKPLPWYPDNLAWQSNFSRNELRKNQALERFHEFLKLENEIGNITRQEAVSMVPPLFLDVHPDHFVLDMCAAPGSKTFQLLEMIYKLAEPGTLPSGMVIANDLDVQRCNLLIHQTKRMCTANLIVTNHEAQHFPSCHLHRKHLADSQNEHVKALGIHQLQFDRVLCDVPCSGDGTLRKAPDIWRKWNAGMGNGLHGLQVQIAMRGVALLKVGGRMVYSTCSMNPVENEAVVAEVLRRCAGSVELVDVSSEIPQLVRRPGLKKWKVRDKGLWLASYKAVPKHRRSVVTPSMFPSGNSYVETCERSNDTENRQLSESEDVMSSEDGPQGTHTDVAPSNNLEAEMSALPLEHCVRIAPHDQNSGAFFIAIFHKVSSLPANERKCTNPPEETDHNSAPSHKQIDEVKEDPNAFDIDSSGASDVQILEPIHDTELLNNVSHESPLDTDHVKIDKDNAREETEGPPKGKRKLQIQGRWKGVDPVTFYKDDSAVDMIMEFYGIKENFPFKGHLVTRNNDSNHVKRVYYVSSSVRRVLELNYVAGQQLKISSVGLKMFERQTSKEGISAPCMFRISSEGLPLILPNVTKQILYVTPLDFKHLLQHKTVKFGDFVNPELGEKASQLMLGCCVVFLSRDSSEANAMPIAIGCWRGRTNVAVMVSALDCHELLERVSVLLTVEAEQKVDEQKKDKSFKKSGRG